MRIIVWFLCLGIFFAMGCNNPNNDRQVSSENGTKEELERKSKSLIQKVLTPEDLKWELNNGSKWQIDPVTFGKFMQIKEQISIISGKMEHYTEDSYRLLGNEILDFLETIPKSTGSEQQALDKVVASIKNECGIMLESDLQSAQIAVINLSVILDVFPEFHTPLSQ